LRLDVFVKLKQQSSSVIVFVGIKHRVRYLLCDVSTDFNHSFTVTSRNLFA